MIIKMLTILLSLTLDFLAIIKVTDGDKDLEIAILSQQVRILQRKAKTTPRITDPERMVLATLTDKFKGAKTGVTQASQSGDLDLQARDGASLAPRTGAAQVDVQAEREARSTWHNS